MGSNDGQLVHAASLNQTWFKSNPDEPDTVSPTGFNRHMPTPKQEATALRQVLADNFRLVAAAEIGTTVHKKVADHYGLSQGTVGRVLGGKTGVTLETLGQLAAALSCQP